METTTVVEQRREWARETDRERLTGIPIVQSDPATTGVLAGLGDHLGRAGRAALDPHVVIFEVVAQEDGGGAGAGQEADDGEDGGGGEMHFVVVFFSFLFLCFGKSMISFRVGLVKVEKNGSWTLENEVLPMKRNGIMFSLGKALGSL